MINGCVLKTGWLNYQDAWDLQRDLHQQRLQQEIPDTLILTEHPHTYTLGKTADDKHLLADQEFLRVNGISVFKIDRGGDITYHGPGQLVGYPILDLHQHYLDVHRFLRDLEEVIIRVLAAYELLGRRETGLTGVWVNGAKVCAIGIKVSRWITMHGFAFNVNTNLSYFGHIVPCGITDRTVTSMQQLLNRSLDLAEVEKKVVEKFGEVFDIELSEKTFRPVAEKKMEPVIERTNSEKSIRR
jgi:lipoyl(octanoyl) transferase